MIFSFYPTKPLGGSDGGMIVTDDYEKYKWFKEAVEAYNKAISLKPDYADAYYNLGNALKEQGKLEDAIKAYKKAISLKPDYAEAYYNIGITLKDQILDLKTDF